MIFHRKVGQAGARSSDSGGPGAPPKTPVCHTLSDNMAWLKSKIGHSADFVIRMIEPVSTPNSQLILAYIDGLVDQPGLNRDIIQALQQAAARHSGDAGMWLNELQHRFVSTGSTARSEYLEDALQSILNGMCLILADGAGFALVAEASGGEQRGVEEPSTQGVLRGPQRSFTENIRTNVALVRRIIHDPELYYEERLIGRRTQTAVGLLYMKGIINETIVSTIQDRLEAIDIDSVLESGYIEEYVQEKTFTPFPTLLNTERPDAAAGALLEGQFVVLVDGTPFVLMGPVTFHKFFQSPEDYYQRFDIASFLRMIRYAGFMISMLLPAVYIAVTTFHQETLPTLLLISLLGQREGIPLPALMEAFLMEITFEVLREAGARMPRAIGPAISIVGALVLGQAAVQAGIVSPAMIIIVAFTAISNFVMPQLNIAIAARLIRFALMLAAGALGFFGIFAGVLIIAIHLTGLKSFGVPYMAPFAPFVPGSMHDIIIRAPLRSMKKRPRILGTKDSDRRPGGSGP
ncbi:spore germination protein KA [Paenibacillus phyllosphaerae]|uniref:Spore germination protein KA n=1 Tax=Paenibacillus phyllosphaerae TaxID=274593 RepID=A0A7W5FP83_9BACL|nr:spore germination protein [Paenibacillus phyllosphaerae]MBB3112106.1 spore germination protein KA [Paenibacillus phyllosphaerae]